MNYIDITPKMEKAQQAGKWSKGEFGQLLDELAEASAGGSVDWDCEAGEDWGRILLGGEVVALLWRRGAFAFLDAGHANAMSSILECHRIQGEIVNDWDEARYKIERLALLRLFECREISDVFDPKVFSVNDLWWATI